MRLATKVLCRTLGTAGIGIAVYNAAKVGGHFSRVESEKSHARYLEKVYSDTRTLDKMNYTDNAIRKKAFEKRLHNPFPTIWGSIKGFFKGSLDSLADMLPVIACSSLALLSKGWLAKAGAIGLGAISCFEVLRNGFGLGKQHPLD